MTTNNHPTWPDAPEPDDIADPSEVEETLTIEDDPLTIAVAERDDYLDQLQRSRAEFVNFRRRNDQERAQLREFVARDITSQFLPVIDDFDRAMTMAPADPQDEKFVQGVEMIRAKLQGIIDRLGITKIDALGQLFDPAVHEAVATEPGTSGSTVVEIYQSGYRIGDTLVRPAMVKTGDPLDGDSDDGAVSYSA